MPYPVDPNRLADLLARLDQLLRTEPITSALVTHLADRFATASLIDEVAFTAAQLAALKPTAHTTPADPNARLPAAR